jgi:hypothetical protein
MVKRTRSQKSSDRISGCVFARYCDFPVMVHTFFSHFVIFPCLCGFVCVQFSHRERNINLWVTKLLQWCGWGLRSSGVWCCVHFRGYGAVSTSRGMALCPLRGYGAASTSGVWRCVHFGGMALCTLRGYGAVSTSGGLKSQHLEGMYCP